MPFIREDAEIFRILSSYRKASFHRKKSGIEISVIDGNRINPGICHKKMRSLLIRREAHLTGCNQGIPVFLEECGYRLNLLKGNFSPIFLFMKTVNIHYIFQFIEQIQILPVRTEAEVPRTGL